MIQRIQTVFLSLVVFSNLGVYFTPIYTHAMNDPQQWIGFGLAISLLISSLLAVYTIFLFKNRRNQIAWTKRTAFVQVIAVGLAVGVFFSLGGIGTYLWDEAIGTGLIVLGIIFLLLALRSISKDEKLVKSMDRIR
ncbi:MAG: DUF4293 family protein [Balneola sp.]|nr:MAG: DUF4293 family protein [Balneola sp.]